MQGNSGDIGTYAYNCTHVNQIQCKREIKHMSHKGFCVCVVMR